MIQIPLKAEAIIGPLVKRHFAGLSCNVGLVHV